MTDPAPHWFLTTQWSVVLAAADQGTAESAQALERLCQAYWSPLYAYARRLGCDVETAQDLTQSFFARLLEKNYVQAANRDRGRFRSFLLASFKNHISKERRHSRALKRGGGTVTLRFEFDEAEARLERELVDERTPLEVYERRWALALLELVFGRLEAEYAEPERRRVFARLKDHLTGSARLDGYRQAGADLGMTEGAVKVAVHRMRKRFRELLLEEVSATVSSPREAEEEIRAMLSVL